MNKDIDSWCVKVDDYNIQAIQNWLKENNIDWYDIIYNDEVIGITKTGEIDGINYKYSSDYFSKVISTEEFLQKINVQQEFSIWN